ncbi:sugar transporter [uncultured Parabacteroides sp.]|uniref:lipopolysaccharide biosynthesis protein n=1 Tax=uncultured Parabacteroides sp. TaxID=512312 RepID=UPI002609630F|nr:sugar transporter [uncultured Parabacteroides sp.]
MSESRVRKSVLNARVNVLFYFATLIVSFFSRKVFLDCLGVDFVGLTGTLLNLLGFLNLAELGIGASIGYVLYKPIFEKQQAKINEIISVLGYLYRYVGIVIAVSGVVLSFFLPLIFKKTIFELNVIYLVYYSFLLSSLIGYFINYRQTLLGADQKNYIVTIYFQTVGLIKTLVQMAIAYYWGNYYAWILIELVFGIIYSIVLNYKINKVYPWLKTGVAIGKQKYPENKIIITKAKQMFVHLLAGTGRNQLLPFLIYAFASLKIVAYYGNYMLIITKINLLVNNLLGSTGAGVGNLIAEGDHSKIQRVYWELTSLRFLVAGFLTFSLYHLVDPFISIWLGHEYILNQVVLVIIMGNFFISQFRGTNDQFIQGYGLFHDTWAPLVTLAITIFVALVGGYFWGLPGVLVGDIASSLTIICVWKSYFLYKEGFHLSVFEYWKQIFKYLGILVVCWLASDFLLSIFPIVNPYTGYMNWFLFAICSSALFLLLYVCSLYYFSKGIRNLFLRVRKLI